MIGNTVDKNILPSLVDVNFPVCLAPMVGLSHFPMRQMMRSYLPSNVHSIWPTEMLSSIKLSTQSPEQIEKVVGPSGETFLVPQLLANEERYIKPSVEKLMQRNIAAIDINMGCPVKKALRHNYGVALMGDINYAAEVVRMTVKHSKVPVSVKIRAGHTGDSGFLVDFSQALVDSGASWICLHPRTAQQKRRGKADWSQIELLRQKIKVPIIGNGDVQTADDVLAMLDQTGCHMVMIGRALTARPWILWQLAEHWGVSVGNANEAPRTPEQEGLEYFKASLKLLDEFETFYSETSGVRKFNFYIQVSSVWLDYGHHLMAKLSNAKSYDQIRVRLTEFFRVTQRMCQKTELRY